MAETCSRSVAATVFMALWQGEPPCPLNVLFSPSVQDKTHWQKGLGADSEVR
jgi:hypothetical protein